jgi:hypothetical protein
MFVFKWFTVLRLSSVNFQQDDEQMVFVIVIDVAVNGTVVELY